MKKFGLILILLATASSAHGDNNRWKIWLVTGDTLKECLLDSLRGEILCLRSVTAPVEVAIDSITLLRFERESHIGSGIAKGCFLSAAAGGVIGYAAYTPNPDRNNKSLGAFIGMIYGLYVGAAVGGTIEAFKAADDVYDLQGLDRSGRIRIVEQILAEPSAR